jgi:hypothetical protein
VIPHREPADDLLIAGCRPRELHAYIVTPGPRRWYPPTGQRT